jgi:type I restriction enzyme S subunit
MSEVPKGWAEATGKDLMRFVRGVAYKKEQASLEPQDGYSGVLRAGNIQGGEIREEDMVYAPNEVISQEQRLQQGDVVVAMSSGSASIVGKAAQVQLPRPDLAFGAFCGVFRPGAPEMAPWLGSFFQTQAYRNVVSSVSAGVNINNLRADHILDLPIPVPPLPEQRRIVAKIETLMARSRAAREALGDIPARLDRYRQSVFNAAFQGELTEAWRKRNEGRFIPASDLLKKILVKRGSLVAKRHMVPVEPSTTDLPALPAGWVWASVDQVAFKIVDGVHKKPDYVENGVPFVTVKNLTAGSGISFDDLNYITKEDHVEFIRRADPEQGDILISKDGTLGVVRQIRTDKPFSIFVSVALVKPVLREMSDFLELAFTSPVVQGQMVGVGSGLQHIHLGDLKADCIPLPPIEEQAEIIREISRAFEGIDRLESALSGVAEQIAILDQSILAKAFRGELVPQDLSDEPAEVLLARIRGSRETQGAPARRRGRPAAAPAPVPAPRPVPAPVALDRAAEEIQAYAADAPARVNLEALDTDALMAAFRQTLATQESWDTDEDLLRSLAQRFGYQRLGSRAKETLKGHLRAALLRRIAVREPDGTLALGPRTLDAYTRDELIDCIPSVLRKGQTLASEDLMRALLHHLGFQRLTDAAQEALKSAFNAAIRRGVLGTEGTARVRRGP